MNEAAFRALVENAPDAIVVSRQGIILYANAAAARLLGHDDVSELVGKPMTFLDRESLDVMRRRIAQMATTGERLVPREYPAKRRDGSTITAEIASTIIPFDGEPAVLAYARDVTERTRLRAQLAQADRLASLGTMAAGVAHEINNPLAFIGLAADMLGRRVGPGEAPLVEQIRAGLQRIAIIVRDLRSFGGGDEDPAGPMDLAAAIDAAERLVAHEIRPRARLTKQLGSLPAVIGVPRRIEQVFVNLLLNAVHAIGNRADGHLAVRARAEGENVVVAVEDDGEGIPEEMLGVIFEPFVTTRRGEGGTGLGLSICRDIVTRVGGTIGVKSRIGEGTTVEVTLVRATGADDAAVSLSGPPQLPADPRSVVAGRVLVIDDEPIIVRLLSDSLASRCTSLAGETDPRRALETILADGELDVVVCDVMMPGLTGVDLHERVARERPDLAERFVFITGGTYTSRARDYLERIGNPRLDKPFQVDRLIEAIERVARGPQVPEGE